MTAKDIITYSKSTDRACLNDGLRTNHLDPEDLRFDDLLSRDQKRAILADWASDARAVEHVPGYRQLDNGALVWLDDIWAALRELDAETAALGRSFGKTEKFRRKRGRVAELLRWSRKGRDDDGDDPPPTPAFALTPSGGRNGLAPAVAVPLPLSLQAA